jgi:hypothetical protein
MAKSYEARLKAYRNTCVNHAQLATVYVKYEIASERPEEAGKQARIAAKWAFEACPDLREEA